MQTLTTTITNLVVSASFLPKGISGESCVCFERDLLSGSVKMNRFGPVHLRPGERGCLEGRLCSLQFAAVIFINTCSRPSNRFPTESNGPKTLKFKMAHGLDSWAGNALPNIGNYGNLEPCIWKYNIFSWHRPLLKTSWEDSKYFSPLKMINIASRGIPFLHRMIFPRVSQWNESKTS